MFNNLIKLKNNIKSTFTINDLESITEIKAHTIRIWEKRYGLLEPDRLNRNIRVYDIDSLLKLLNVALLYKHGLKISKIAKLSEEDIIKKTREYVNSDFKNDKALASLKLSMYNFDVSLFNEIYNEQIKSKTFSEVFQEVFIPFLTFMGLQWQTKALVSAHEHFITNLIYQKIQLNIENLNSHSVNNKDELYVLYLPEEEMHEIGILYLNYELLLSGKRTIYLGRSIPVNDLVTLQSQFDKITWVSQFTVSPSLEFIQSYLEEMEEKLAVKNNYWAVSHRFKNLNYKQKSGNLKLFNSIKEALKEI